MTARLRLGRLHCTQPSNSAGDQVALAVYAGPESSPTSWIWTSGEETMHQGNHWDVNATTSNFDGEVSISLMEPDDDGVAVRSYGRLQINAAGAPTAEAESPQARFELHGARYTLDYRVLAAAPALINQPAADSQLEPDLGMLRNGSRQPLTRRLGEIKAAVSNTQDFQNKVLQLARLCREAVQRYERERLESYLDATTEDDAQKTAKATLLARDSARMEFLVGWMYYQGYNSGESWEVDNENHGPFPDIYKGEVGNTMRGTREGAWCTMFCGTNYRWLGFDIANATSDKQEKRIFWSGYRLQDWGRNGRNVGGSTIGDAINESTGGAVSRVNRRSAWADPVNTRNPVTWSQLWDDLQDRGMEPQPGDIILIRHYGHTVMVDDVEADGDAFYVYTVEGNANQAVRSQRINIRADSHVQTFEVKTRRCLANNLRRCVTPPRNTPANQIRRQYQRRYGIALIRPGWDNFAEEAPAANQAVVASDDMDNGASNVISFENLAPPGELLTAILEELKGFMVDGSLPNGPWIQNPQSDRVWDWCGKPTGNHSIN